MNIPGKAIRAAADAMLDDAGIVAALEAAAPFIAAQAWDEGHRTYVQREADECQCGAWDVGECACGLYGTGKIVTPNPYRIESEAPNA